MASDWVGLSCRQLAARIVAHRGIVHPDYAKAYQHNASKALKTNQFGSNARLQIYRHRAILIPWGDLLEVRIHPDALHHEWLQRHLPASVHGQCQVLAGLLGLRVPEYERVVDEDVVSGGRLFFRKPFHKVFVSLEAFDVFPNIFDYVFHAEIFTELLLHTRVL